MRVLDSSGRGRAGLTGGGRTGRRPALAAALVLGVVVVLAGAWLGRSHLQPAEPVVVAGYLPVDSGSGYALDAALDEGLTEVSPVWATVRADGALETVAFPAAVREGLERPGVRVLPTVQNYADGQWQGERVADLLADPRRAEAHRRHLVEEVLANGWDGIDVDYESLPPAAGESFTDFIAALADDLHAQGLEVSVAVPARASDEDTWTLAYSYQRLGEVADQVRVMAYDHAWGGSTAGPVAPMPWVEDVVAYALERIPRDKLMLGIATYGYDWVGATGTYLPTTAVFELASENGAVPRWDHTAASTTFRYAVDGEEHTVWYEDARSLDAKLAVAVREGLRGVALWQVGGEDPGVWGAVADVTAD
ncbi:glycosyl hydrolase family 18 protein [Blastococcus capsensis]|uniref:glycosyl hydrolase family 18 protein n=1 Tax=Blastococcus capsensis TaxID=1564163 RepID=UPI0025417355|nr:glycosyl hydrolase family 18 protein [Blastococcus capsensis]MDK3257081.1 glycosyl hydrolase family 18 protein [Blastococcus capsensis]